MRARKGTIQWWLPAGLLSGLAYLADAQRRTAFAGGDDAVIATFVIITVLVTGLGQVAGAFSQEAARRSILAAQLVMMLAVLLVVYQVA